MKARFVSNLILASGLMLTTALSQATVISYYSNLADKSGAAISQPAADVVVDRYYATGFKSGAIIGSLVADVRDDRYYATGGFKSGAVISSLAADVEDNRYYDIPEPGTVALFGVGLIAISLFYRKQRY